MIEKLKRLEFELFDPYDEGEWPFDEFVAQIRKNADEHGGGDIIVTSEYDYDTGLKFRIVLRREETAEEKEIRIAQDQANREFAANAQRTRELVAYLALKAKFEGIA